LRYQRTTGLMLSQMQELVARVAITLPAPWNKKIGRPKACGLYRAVEIACMYLRHNGTEEFLGDLLGVSQSTVSRIVTTLVPVVKAVLAEFVPDAKQAMEWVTGRVCLVDGTITPCWSYAEHRELWSRKHGTTGFTAQLVSLLDGSAVYISDPLPGKTHDATAFTETRLRKSWSTPVAGSGTKATKVAREWSPPERSHPAENSAKPTTKATPKSRHCGHPSNDSSLISSHGGSFTPTTAAPTPPTTKPMMPHADCSSSQSSGVLNNVQCKVASSG
jgi:hypothetical protein